MIENDRQLEVTRWKLAELEKVLAEAESKATTNEHLKQLTIRSLRRTKKQLTEEIILFEIRSRKLAEAAK